MADRNANYQSDLGSLKVNRIIHFRVSISQNVSVYYWSKVFISDNHMDIDTLWQFYCKGLLLYVKYSLPWLKKCFHESTPSFLIKMLITLSKEQNITKSFCFRIVNKTILCFQHIILEKIIEILCVLWVVRNLHNTLLYRETRN